MQHIKSQTNVSMNFLNYLDSIEDTTYTKFLVPDPESDKYYPNQHMREVKSGHYVIVKCTPLKNPFSVAISENMMNTLGFTTGMAKSQEFLSFFSGCNNKRSWSTPYALSIYGKEMYSNCPFKNGNGYGDGRATSLAEVVVQSKRWELQLKGCGKTPFSRSGDGKAVLRSSVREFLVSEAMYHLGVPTTRALTITSSKTDMVERPWFSSDHQRDVIKKHDIMESSGSTVLCRVASSFLRVGHVELFSRRFLKSNDRNALRELKMLVQYIIFREYNDINKSLSFEDQVIMMLRSTSHKFANLVCNWLRVGYVQGNFNSDNCHVAGITLDYGPFGFMSSFDPLWNPWIDGGAHFAFINQIDACAQNFYTFVDAVVPLFNDDPAYENECEKIKNSHLGVTMNKINKMWAAKLGFQNFTYEVGTLRDDLFKLMEKCEADYTLIWRQLSEIVKKIISEDLMLDLIQNGFYKPLTDKNKREWITWINNWISTLSATYMNQVPPYQTISNNMKRMSPKFIPREWMLVSAYTLAASGDSSMIYELQKLFETPYDEHVSDGLAEKYYKLSPAYDKSNGGSCAAKTFTSCSS